MKTIKKLFAFFFDRSFGVFLIIGGINTVVSMAINFALNYFAHWPLFFSSAFSFAVCSVPGFYFNRKYSFKSAAPLGQSIFRFSLIITGCFLLSYTLNNLVMPFLRGNIFSGVNATLYSFLRIVVLQVVFTVLNYLGQRLWAFKK